MLDALIALSILSVAVLSLSVLLRDATATMQRADDAAVSHRRASQLFTAASLWSRGELQQRLGARVQGPFVMTITQVDPAIFRLTLRDTGAGAARLETRLYRPDSVDDAH